MTARRGLWGSFVVFVLAGCGSLPPGTDGGVDSGAGGGGGTEACVTTFPKQIAANYTVEKGCYLVLESPVIADAVTLTLKPGVKLVFSQDTELQFSADQVLEAVGTAADPILLTGSMPVRGHWSGLRFEGTANPSHLAYLTVEWAGDTTSDADAAAVKMVADSRGVRASFDHVTLQDNQGWGLYASGSAIFSGFTNNTLRRNGKGPANLDSVALGWLDGTSTFSGNDVDRLEVRASGILASTTWHALDVPYHVKQIVTLNDGFDLTIEAGARFVMAPDSRFLVSEGASALIVAGTATAPVIFTGETQTRGAWDGLRFDLSNNTRNRLSYAVVEYAGDIASDAEAAAVKLTADSRGVQVKFDHVTLRQSAGYGLYLGASAIVPQFTDNVLSFNAKGPVRVGSLAAHWLDPSSTYTGNDVNEVSVDAQWVGADDTWRDLHVPYVVDGDLRPQGMWTIGAGVVLQMKPQTAIRLGGDGPGLRALGTATSPVLITGTVKTRGSWDGLHFDNNNSANLLDYCTVEYGGGGQRFGWQGMIVTTSDSRGVTLNVSNSTIQHSAQYGIWFNSRHQGTVTNVTYADNASGNLFQQQ